MDGILAPLASCLLSVLLLAPGTELKRDRVYYVGIVEDLWDYAPSGKNLLNGRDVETDE